jgi:hypothetical protein
MTTPPPFGGLPSAQVFQIRLFTWQVKDGDEGKWVDHPLPLAGKKAGKVNLSLAPGKLTIKSRSGSTIIDEVISADGAGDIFLV